MSISVLINTYNRPQSLEKCLAALARHSAEAGEMEVVVVDDGGAADLAPVAAPWRERLGVRLIRIEHSGPGGARGRALREARYRRVFCLGDDVLVQPGCLARHARHNDPLVAVVGPYVWSGLKGSPPFRRWADPVPQIDVENPENAGFKYFCTGNLSADRDTLLEAGGFDKRFEPRYGWEDIDLGLKFERAGGRIIFDREARAVHEHPFSDRHALWRRERAVGINAYIFWEKWAAVDPAAVAFMKFWDDAAALGEGSRLRRAIGDALIGALDRLAPGSKLNERLYERMVFAHRLAGVAEGWRIVQGRAAPDKAGAASKA